MTRYLAVAVAVCAVLYVAGSPRIAAAGFGSVDCGGDRETRLSLAAGFDAEIVLEPGEMLVDAIHADPGAWDPHAIYDYRTVDRQRVATPHLIFRPQVAGLEANVILTTTRRTYRFFLTSTSSTERTYLRCRYPDNRVVKPVIAPAAFPSAPATPAPTPEPALEQICTDFDFPVKQMQVLGNARFIPSRVCDDGEHTYVELATPPLDTPALWVIGVGGDDQMGNFTFDIKRLRYKLDGVYPTIALILGSGKTQQRVVIVHG